MTPSEILRLEVLKITVERYKSMPILAVNDESLLISAENYVSFVKAADRDNSVKEPQEPVRVATKRKS